MHSIIIPTHGRVDSLITMLDNLPSSLKLKSVEILIVDNNLDPIIQKKVYCIVRELFNKSWNIKVIACAEIGLTAARHAGLNAASGDVITYFDDDIIVSDGWFSAVSGAFQDPNVHLVGGPCLPYLIEGAPNWFWRTFSAIDNGWINHFYSLIDFSTSIKNINPEYIFGLNYSIRRETIMKLKGFNPDLMPKERQYFQGDGETGLSKKIASLNLRADFVKGALIHHQIGAKRLSKEYLNKRSYFQGVVDSYSSIRQLNRLSYARYVKHVFFVWACQLLHRKNSLYNYSKGYISHQQSVSKNSKLKSWVEQSHYYDV